MGGVTKTFNKQIFIKITSVIFIFQLIIAGLFTIIFSNYWNIIISVSIVSFLESVVVIYIILKPSGNVIERENDGNRLGSVDGDSDSSVNNDSNIDNHIDDVSDNEHTSISNTFLIANETLPHLKEGLNEESAQIIAGIIKNISDVAAVAITDTEKVLAFIGTGCEKHPVGKPIVTNATLAVIMLGHSKIIKSKEGFNCRDKNCICPLESAVIVPLFNKDEVIGTLKLYQTVKGQMPNYIVKLATGLAQILSMQIEMVELEHQAQLATEAQLDALQAQINPHFLFNALNTIKMYINKDPEYARDLLVRLSTLLRYLLGSYGRYITLEEEINYIEDYVMIEKARFVDKLKVEIDIQDDAKKCLIPVFSVQPLVNNAILHGILPNEVGGVVKIVAYVKNNELIISIEDNGIGIPQDKINKIYNPRYGSGCGVGIPNVNERLKILYGAEYRLKIESEVSEGTKAWFKIPCIKTNGE